jgi:hypothetical protein
MVTGCNGTGGGPSDSGNQFVFQARGRLNLVASLGNVIGQSAEDQQSTADDPTVLTLLATLLDPQGNPFRNRPITFVAEFADVTFIPQDRDPITCDPASCSNRGVAWTDDRGQAQILLIAGLTTGRMRVLAEAPPELNIATGITVTITNQGFITIGTLGIIPAEVIFINPLVRPGEDGPMTIFNAVGGTPSYSWDNSNKDLGEIEPIGLPNINQQAEYTLIGPIPIGEDEEPEVLQDTVTLLDSDGSQATANVTVIFAECELTLSVDEISIGDAIGGEQARITVENGVPFSTGDPYTVTQTFPESGTITFDPQDPNIIIFTVATPPIAVDPDTLLIRDSRGCVATVAVTVTPAPLTLVLTAEPNTICEDNLPAEVTITANVFNKNNQPVEGLTILFTTTAGTLDPFTEITDANGQATTELTIPAGTTGTVTVTGTAPGGTPGGENSGDVNITISSDSPPC